jgi:spectinomycin phosphotransferase
MIEKPDISDEKVITALDENYSVKADTVEFLPIGNDASAWAYRVKAENQGVYFLKIRTEIANPAGFLVPRFLQDHGMEQALAPLPTQKHELWARVEDFFFILYPFVTGTQAMEVGMSDLQWKTLGTVLKRIHFTELPSDIVSYIRRETFVPKWSGLTKELHKQVNTQSYDDAYQKELATFWKGNSETIQTIVERTERLGKYLQQLDLEFVLCHADIHTANILITPEQEMFIVDWVDTLLAPKERDLMFVLSGDTLPTREEQLFFDGYRNMTINQLALAYYRYEWCVQEIGDFGKRVFLTKDLGESTKQDAVEGFIKLFSRGDVIDGAFRTAFESEIRNNS